jgi:hypothetical protein
MPKLTKLQKSFLRSERDSVPLLERLAAHLAKDAQVPSDLKEAFIEAVKAGVRGHIKSWDEVFGRPNTSQQYEEFCKALELGFAIEKMADQAKGHLNEERFEKIGKELGISSTKTKETLNWWRRLIDDHS